MSIMQFLQILLARWKLILATTLACVLVATTIANLLPKRYPATARVILDVRQDPVTGEMLMGRGNPYLGTQMQIIRDMRVAGAVVDRLGLLNDPSLIASYESSGRSAVDGGMRAWLGQQIIDNTSVGMVGGSSIVELTYQADNPDRAKEIVGVLRDAYIQESLRLRTDPAGRSSAWFRTQTDAARVTLAESEAVLSAYMLKNNIILVGGMDSETAKLASLQAALQQAQGMASSNTVTTSARLGNDPVADQMAIQLAAIEDELALASARLGTAHPTYKAILARRNTVASQLSQARSRSQASVAAMSGATRQSVAELTGQVEAQSKFVLSRKPILDELIRLSREVELKRVQYEEANKRTDQLKLAADQSEPGITVMGDPTASKTPSYPKVGQIIGLSIALGLGLGLVSAMIAEFIARRVRGYQDLAHASGAPVLAIVGSKPASPLRDRLQRLFGRRSREDLDGDLQAI
ncbi:MAG: Wzz/FepE/Etk N-terminal domain-containing protein [Sandaracinobacteroides sp.]